ncbi:MAG: guanylate kinase [Phycisphaerales bacterium]|nr:guanylate kinase [Phycisphaerales bacterium]
MHDHSQAGDVGILLIVAGPSGVGKTTITRELLRRCNAVFSVSATTRPKTTADTEGVDYFFLTDDQFEQRRLASEFLEWADVFDCKYGTPCRPVIEHLDAGRLVILEIDVRGARQVKDAMPDAFGIFILPPSEEILLKRLRGRKRETEEVIQRRFAEARREIAEAREGDLFDVLIVNDDLEEAIDAAVAAVETERARRATR